MPPPIRRRAFTLLDCVATVSIVSILSAIAFPRVAGFMDAIRVHGAARDAFAMFSAARHLAVSRSAQTTIEIDTLRNTMSVRVGSDTLRRRDFALVHDVKLSSNRPAMTYSAAGIGYGAGNLTLVLRRKNAVDSLVVSRLGRVRH